MSPVLPFLPRRLRAWILAERPGARLGSADIQLSALRVVLLSSLLLTAVVGLHSGVMGLLMGKPLALAIVLVITLLLGLAVAQASHRGRSGALLLAAVYVAAAAISVTTGTQPEISRLGYVLCYAAPLVAGLLVSWRVAMGLMLLNVGFFAAAVLGWLPPQLPERLIRLPHSLLYVHATLFMFFNLCLPLAVFRMVAGLGQVRRQLNHTRALSEQVFQAASGPSLVCDAQGLVLRANKPFLALCGLDGEGALRGSALERLFVGPLGEPRAWRPEPGLHWRLAGEAGRGAREVLLRAVYGLDGQVHSYAFEDVTELRRTQADLAASVQREAWATWHDALTGLPNRARCIQMLDARCRLGLAAADEGLLTLRISHLRQINARYGVATGDELLQSFVRLLLGLLPPGAQAARVRGSVLAVLLPAQAGADAPARLLAQARALRAALPLHALADRQTVALDLVFGLVSLHELLQRQPRADGAEFLRCSELALDMAQDPRWRESFDGLVHFDAVTAQTVARSMAIEAELPRALEGRQLQLVYQPQQDAAGAQRGFEALVRWHSPVLGTVPPAEFIPVAEDCGLVGGISDWVIATACAQLAAWRATALLPADGYFAINLSARDLERPGLFEVLQTQMDAHGLRPAQLELEVTESALARQPGLALAQLRRLHAAGFRIAIDDFGTGYSSLAKLVDLPIDVLKIDRSFLQQLPGDARRERVLRSMVGLAHSLKLRIVAEGVESEAQVLFLHALGVQLLQGYYYGRPEPAAHWEARLPERLSAE